MWPKKYLSPASNGRSLYIEVQDETPDIEAEMELRRPCRVTSARHEKKICRQSDKRETFHEMRSVLIQICHQENELGDSRLDRRRQQPPCSQIKDVKLQAGMHRPQAGGVHQHALLVSINPSWHGCIRHLSSLKLLIHICLYLYRYIYISLHGFM